MDAPKQPTRLDPILQLEQMKAEARLAKLKQQAQEPVELSDSEDNDEEGRDAEKPSTADGQAAEGGEAQANDVKITLKIKSSEHPEGLKMRIGMHQPFSRLFAAYKAAGEDAGWLSEGTAVTFKFDGERLGSKETPESLDLEGDEVIDACW